MPWWSFVAKKQTFELCKNTPLSFLFQLCFFIFFKHNSHFHLCVSVTYLQVFPLPLFWNVDCESHSLRFWLPFKVRHIANSKTGCTSINQSWRHHYKVLLIASMGMGAYSLRQSDSSRHTEIGWINSPSSSLYWTSLLITLLLFKKKVRFICTQSHFITWAAFTHSDLNMDVWSLMLFFQHCVLQG